MEATHLAEARLRLSPEMRERQWQEDLPRKGISILGLGGNLIPTKRFFDHPIAGTGKVWSALRQYLQLFGHAEQNGADAETRIFVSHVSPGKEQFITLFGGLLSTDWIVSGHMDPPAPFLWVEAAVRGWEEAVNRIRSTLEKLRRLADSRRPCGVRGISSNNTPARKLSLRKGKNLPSGTGAC